MRAGNKQKFELWDTGIGVWIMSQCTVKKVIAKLHSQVQNLQCQIDE